MSSSNSKPDKKLSLIIVVNGVATEPPIETSANAAFASIISKALTQTQNSGRPVEDWILKDAKGTELKPNQKPSDYGLVDGATLFLTLTAGVGGLS